MDNFKAEVLSNFVRFFEGYKDSLIDVVDEISGSQSSFESSYFRVVSLQAWQSELFCEFMSEDVQAFFKEALNDAIMSHMLARQGAWRVALMSLRSLIENTLVGLYYYEHPVELFHWSQGEHKLGFAECLAYLSKHPNISRLDQDLTGLDQLKSEYSTLSKAVHGSAVGFRMTRDGMITGLNFHSASGLGSWGTREQKVIAALNLLLVCFFSQKIKGTAYPNLRKAVGIALPARKFSTLKTALGVSLGA